MLSATVTRPPLATVARPAASATYPATVAQVSPQAISQGTARVTSLAQQLRTVGITAASRVPGPVPSPVVRTPPVIQQARAMTPTAQVRVPPMAQVPRAPAVVTRAATQVFPTVTPPPSPPRRVLVSSGTAVLMPPPSTLPGTTPAVAPRSAILPPTFHPRLTVPPTSGPPLPYSAPMAMVAPSSSAQVYQAQADSLAPTTAIPLVTPSASATQTLPAIQTVPVSVAAGQITNASPSGDIQIAPTAGGPSKAKTVGAVALALGLGGGLAYLAYRLSAR